MARTYSENYDGIHLGILINAAKLFSAQGYMRASITDLADACKLLRLTVRVFLLGNLPLQFRAIQIVKRGRSLDGDHIRAYRLPGIDGVDRAECASLSAW
ncbi:hypothetical protein [Bradyrhizobium sp. JYMT SZCCT0428]|uniref:hypothetical protein n=1 Tax=Bradyrhizobium sp. JYMT SZCCT0428 TaxID=2807673 RepID=UPI00201336BC|nr:hypothetical protein [Bradyrhizobium sp. JYMT SZCCT0428]